MNSRTTLSVFNSFLLFGLLVWVFSWLFFLYPVYGQTPPWEKENIVRSIQLDGVKKISRREVRKALVGLQPPPFWKFWKKSPLFSRDTLEKGLKQIRQVYRRKGFYQTSISPQVTKKEGGVTIILTIDEGPKVIIEDIIFTFRDAEASKWEKQFQQIIPLRKGNTFLIEDYEKAKTKILEILANSGYPRAKLSSKVLIYERDNRAGIHFTIELGPLTRFGKIEVVGNKKISPGIILREITFTQGEVFSMAKVFQSQAKIFGLTFFRSVLLDTVDLNEGTGPVDIRILVQERRPRTIEAGLGYGTEDNLRFRLSGVYRNFLGRARELRLSLKFSSLTKEGALTFKQPYFPDPSSTFSWTLSRRTDEFVSFETVNISNEVRIEKKLSSILSTFAAYRLDSSEINDLAEVTREKLEYQQEETYFLSYFQAGITLDTSDSPLNPSTGYITSLFAEPSLQVIGSEVSYFKGTIEHKHFFPIPFGAVLAGRVFMGTIQPFGLNQRGVPLFKRFFSGGTYSVRGYKYQKLGPLDQSGKPIGGNSLLEGNTEIRFPLIGRLWGVVFLDVGNVFLETGEFKMDDLRYSTGTGIRYNTIVGPLRLDFGYILNPDETQPKRYRFHFSIGQAF